MHPYMNGAPMPATSLFQRPAPVQALASRPTLGRPVMGQQLGAAGNLLLGLVSVGLAGATAYVGVNYGQDKKGFKSAMGWIVGIGGGLALLSRGAGLLTAISSGDVQVPSTAVPVMSGYRY